MMNHTNPRLVGQHSKPLQHKWLMLFFGATLGFLSAAAEPVQGQRSVERPNVVLIMIDDLGWTDIGCYGNDFVDTPHIDQLARQGMRFTNFYAAGAVCSPTRCAVQTGQNQARIGITAHIPGHWRPFERVITPPTKMGLPTDVVTIAQAMKASGYATAYVGKWHLNDAPPFSPENRGYDEAAVINGAHYQGRYRVVRRPDLKPQPGQYRTEFEADLSIDFIKRQSEAGKPFFLMVSPFAVHIPLGAMSQKVDKYRKRAEQQQRTLPHPVYAAMIEHCDDLVGRIIATLEDQNISDQTMVLFTSDNGGLYRRYDYRAAADDTVTEMKPLRGEKGSLHEGGIRVPLIVKYPGVVAAGSQSDLPTISYDFFPTCVAAAGGSLPENQIIDGINLMPVLSGNQAAVKDRALHWHYPHYHHDRPASAIRVGDWKLIQYLDGTEDVELYNLKDDLSERVNLVDQEREKFNQLKRQLQQWRQSVLAAMPISNPAYDPEKSSQWWSRARGKPVNSDARKRFPPTEKDISPAAK